MTVAGPVPGSGKANPNPSSPIFSSLLAIHASANVEETTEGFTLTPADHAALKGGAKLTLTNGKGDKLTIELVADFPDFTPEPRPNFADNVRPSNPFGVVVNGNLLYVVDASQNLVRVVGGDSGAYTTLATFAPFDHPLPFGPPKIDPVPDSIRLFGDQLLVPTLTGFPFPPGVAQVKQIDLITGAQQPLIRNLTAAIDVLPVRVPTDENKSDAASVMSNASAPDSLGQAHFFVLSFSNNFTQNAPGRLLLFDSATDTTPATIAAPLISPTSLARDPRNGDIFITSIFTGLVIRVSFARELTRRHYLDFLKREPDQAGWDFWAGNIEGCGADEQCFERKSVDVSRAFFYSNELIALRPELHESLRGSVAYNREFVRQCYFAYLKRACDPEACDAEGFNFWVIKLNSRMPSSDADYNEMIRAFVASVEYRSRFGLQ